MKKFVLFSTVFLIFLNVSAQNYQNICSPGKSLYASNSIIKGFRIDSIVPFGNADTLFLSFPAARDTSGYCLDTTGGSVLGSRAIRYHDGWFNFFNYRHDTIFFNARARVNDSWKFVSLPQKAYLEARVHGMAVDSFAGVTDSVKIIFLQAKDSLGLNINNIFNSKEIRLSKNFGFAKIYDLYLLPLDTVAYLLAGKSQPSIGLQEVTVQDIYDFNIGDEFHFTGYEETLANNTFVYDWKEIWTILDKTFSVPTDSVTYEIRKCRLTLITRQVYGDTVSYSKSDTTVNQSYDFLQLAVLPQFTRFPDEYTIRNSQSGIHQYYWRTSQYDQRMMKGDFQCPSRICTPTCYFFSPEVCQYYEFTKGLGMTKDYKYYYNYGSFNYSHQLVWYKKGPETWGTPVAADCQQWFPYLTCTPNPVILESTTMSQDTLMINSNSNSIDWQVVGFIPSWLSIVPLTGKGSGSVIFRTEQVNDDTISRSSEFILSSYQLSPDVPITVIQKGKSIGITEYGQLITELYPNPTTGLVRFRSAERVDVVKVFNPVGILLQSIPVNDNMGVLNLSETGSGLFILRFIAGKHEVNLKVVVL